MGADDLHTATSQQEVLDFGNSLLTRDQECPIESAETLPTNDLPRHDHAHEYNSRTAPPNLELSAILRNALDKEGKFTRDQVFVSDTQILWNASVVLMAHWRAANVSFADETVLEMGSGLGHLAFSLATEHQCAKIVATDQAKHLHLLENSVKEQVQQLASSAGSEAAVSAEARITIKPLQWGAAGTLNDKLSDEQVCEKLGLPSPSSPLSKKISAIICSEIFYDVDVHEDIIWTWRRVLDIFPDAEIWTVFVNRDFSWNLFMLLDESSDHFEVEAVEKFDDMGLEDVHMHRVWRKSAASMEDVHMHRVWRKSAASKGDSAGSCREGEAGGSGSDTEEIKAASPSPEGAEEGVKEAEVSCSEKTSGRSKKSLLGGKEQVEGAFKRSSLLPVVSEGASSGPMKEDKSSSPASDEQDNSDEGDKTTIANPDEDKSVWEILDELIGIHPQKLRVYIQSALGFLVCMSAFLIRQALLMDETTHAWLFGGFLFCVVMLSLSVEFVIAEAGRLNEEKKRDRGAASGAGEENTGGNKEGKKEQ